jgi:hypothetical protein
MNKKIKNWGTIGTKLDDIIFLEKSYLLKFQNEKWELKTEFDGDGDYGLEFIKDFTNQEQTCIIYYLFKNGNRIKDVKIRFQIISEYEEINWCILFKEKYIGGDCIIFSNRENDEFGIYDLMNIIKLCNIELKENQKSQHITYRYQNRIDGF